MIRKRAGSVCLVLAVPLGAGLATLSAAAGEPGLVVRAATGEPRVDMRAGSPARLLPRAEYEQSATGEERIVPPEHDPWKDASDVSYFLFGDTRGRQVTAAVRIGDADGRQFLVDSNRNGDLRDEDVVPAEQAEAGERAIVHLTDPDVMLGFKTWAPPQGPMRLLVMADNLRDGVATVEGQPVKFTVQGRFGAYGAEWQPVYFDTNGDGEIDDDFFSDERYVTGDSHVNLAGHSWSIDVNEDGGELTLTALDDKLPDRVRLAPGNPAPDFTFTDIDGNEGRLSDYLGKVVVLYLWGTWCGPCREETPHLIEAFETFHERGLEILGVAKQSKVESVRKYIEEYGIDWRQTTDDEGGPIVSLYRADAVPNALIIDREGKIVERAARGFQMLDLLENLFPAAEPEQKK